MKIKFIVLICLLVVFSLITARGTVVKNDLSSEKPDYSICQVSGDSLILNTMCNTRRNIGISYLCARKTAQIISGAQALYRLPNGTYRIEFFNPANNKKNSEQTVVSTNLRYQYPVNIPNFTDDILLKLTKTKNEIKTNIPGTD